MAWYVVFRGRRPGVYRDWASCHDQATGFSNCAYKSYRSEDEAVNAYRAYLLLPSANKSTPSAVSTEQHQVNAPPPNDGQWKDVLIAIQFILIVYLVYNFLL